MKLWIRSQNKATIVKINNQIGLKYNDNKTIIANYFPDFSDKYDGSYDILGTYESKERALEVLDEIDKVIIENEAISLCAQLENMENANKNNFKATPVYHMPEN